VNVKRVFVSRALVSFSNGVSIDHAKGAHLTSEDGGGPGSISQLLIMNEFLRGVEYDLDLEEGKLCPADYCDLMGGVGFGGYASLVTTYLKLISCR
jgi:hypothetical protein